MTFEEFQASRTWCEDLGKALQDESLQGIGGNLYDNSFYIGLFSDQPRKWWLIIERGEYVSADLAQLERRLWDEFADGEING